jgi:ribosomal protein S18 acetylase RimI-like enzyme
MALTAGRRSRERVIGEAQTLSERNLPALRLDWQSNIDVEEVQRALYTYPGRSVWLPETLEFAVVAPWRHRPEVANIRHLMAVRHPELLVNAVIDRCAVEGAVLVVAVEVEEVRHPAFYQGLQFDLLEEVVTYELDRLPLPAHRRGRLRFVPVDPTDPDTMATLLAIDQAAFPWLWRNNRLEFASYSLTPGVELYLGYLDDEPISYLGLTAYLGWGHLDRIAVVPELHSQGYGQEGLAFAIDRCARMGARRIGLSTQRGNVHSQHLYEKAGFRRAWGNDYRLYGRYLQTPEDLE